ncbi:MAG: PD-(D/E)XK nuclease family transposase, partial [Rickettsiaceae bacterium]|nr:PD-(D/E)XK nuclease family transposase [Rickettsiaceae bacterium]
MAKYIFKIMAKRKLSDPQSLSAAASIASSSLPGASKHSSLADTSSSYSPSKIRSSFETYQVINDTLQERYADPTLDVTFKMLFCSNENKDILISLVNSLLEFEGDREVVEVSIESPELRTSYIS